MSLNLGAALPSLGWDEILFRLALAAVLGGVIGIERELRDRYAGLRTHLLVSVGSALFTLVSAYGFRDFIYGHGIGYDPTRIAAQVVTGIGFLGAGAIIRQGFTIHGLTTAATLWVAAAIGMTAAAGFYTAAVLATIVALFVLWPLRIVEHRYIARIRSGTVKLGVELKTGASVASVLSLLESRSIAVDNVEIREESGGRRVTLDLELGHRVRLPDVADDLLALEGVTGAQWAH